MSINYLEEYSQFLKKFFYIKYYEKSLIFCAPQAKKIFFALLVEKNLAGFLKIVEKKVTFMEIVKVL